MLMLMPAAFPLLLLLLLLHVAVGGVAWFAGVLGFGLGGGVFVAVWRCCGCLHREANDDVQVPTRLQNKQQRKRSLVMLAYDEHGVRVCFLVLPFPFQYFFLPTLLSPISTQRTCCHSAHRDCPCRPAGVAVGERGSFGSCTSAPG